VLSRHIRGIETSTFDWGWFKKFMQKNISNAFENVPFGDLKYGLLGSVPAEMLHVSGTSLLKHMFDLARLFYWRPQFEKKKKD
jgi:hypothetical protein